MRVCSMFPPPWIILSDTTREHAIRAGIGRLRHKSRHKSLPAVSSVLDDASELSSLDTKCAGELGSMLLARLYLSFLSN